MTPAEAGALRPGWHGVRRAVTALSLLWVCTAAGAVMVFLTQTLLARKLGPEQFGLFASSLATVTMVAPLAGFGLSQFRLKAYGVEGWDADRWLRPTFSFSIATLSLACALVVAWALLGARDAATREVLLVLAPVILGVFASDLMGSRLRLEERYGGLALWQLLIPLGRFAVAGAILLVASAGASMVAIGYCVVSLLVTAMAWPSLSAMLRGEMRLHGHGPRQPGPVPPSPGIAELWSSAWPYGLAAAQYPVLIQVSKVLHK
jgi:O-antigen/teichoic acid export membrane protein